MTTVNVTIDKNGVTQVGAPGPQGTRGATGATGPAGPIVDGVTTLEENFSPTDVDWSAALVRALATGKTLVLGAKTYLVESAALGAWAIGVVATAGQGVVGQGDQSVLQTTSDKAVLDITAERVALENFRIVGSGKGSGKTSQHGVTCGHDAYPTPTVPAVSRISITNVVCEDMGGRAFSLEFTSIYALGPRLTSCFAYDCNEGFYIAFADYVTAIGCVANACTRGVYVATGNLCWAGGSISANGTGIEIQPSGNDAHGIFAGVEINHNTTPVKTGAIINSHTFDGCHIYGGTIDTSAALEGVHFDGGQIDVDAITANTKTVFRGVTWPMAYANTVTGSPVFTPDNLLKAGTGFALADVGLYSDASHKIFGSAAGDVHFEADVASFRMKYFHATKAQDLALANGDNSNIATTRSFVRVSGPTGAFAVTGMANGTDGVRLTLFNTTAQAMTLKNENASSSAANRISTLTGADVVLPARTSSATFIYDATLARWVLTGTS